MPKAQSRGAIKSCTSCRPAFGVDPVMLTIGNVVHRDSCCGVWQTTNIGRSFIAMANARRCRLFGEEKTPGRHRAAWTRARGKFLLCQTI